MCLQGCILCVALRIQHFNKLMFDTGLLKCCKHVLLVAFEI